MRYGLIGEKLGHSYSKIIHEKLADYQYDLIPLSKEEFKVFMEKKDFTAINITIPYKQEVIPYLYQLDPLAKEIGAVNTIINKDGKLYGFNTDYYGFEYMVSHNQVVISGKKCLILGNGGTSHTVYTALSHLGASEIITVGRTAKDDVISYEDCNKLHTDAEIIVNTTPSGMYPKLIDEQPIDLTPYHSCVAVLDMVYNPIRTKLALQADKLGIQAVTGLEMLVAQAKRAVEHFLGNELDDQKIEEIYQYLLKKI